MQARISLLSYSQQLSTRWNEKALTPGNGVDEVRPHVSCRSDREQCFAGIGDVGVVRRVNIDSVSDAHNELAVHPTTVSLIRSSNKENGATYSRTCS